MAAALALPAGVLTAASAAAAPAAPTSVRVAHATEDSLTMRWNEVEGATGYTLERADSLGGPWTEVASTDERTVFATDAGIDTGAVHYYRAVASDGSGTSAPSAVGVGSLVGAPEVEVPDGGLALDLGSGAVADGATGIGADTAYTAGSRLGFVDPAAVTATDRGTPDAVRSDFVTVGDTELVADLPAGDYTVDVVAGDAEGATDIALTVEQMAKVESVQTGAGEFVETSFDIALVDGQLNIEFSGAAANLAGLTITPQAEREPGEESTVWITGDSTVQTYDPYWEPQAGWGQMFDRYVDGVAVQNKSIGGRSSKNFISQGRLDEVLTQIRPGDVLYVQFGHNDNSYGVDDRYAAPADYRDYLRTYVDGARQRGATPILVTPVSRRDFDPDTGKFNVSFPAYVEAASSLAAELDVPLVDLAASSRAYLDEIGPEAAKSVFLHTAPGQYPNRPEGTTDNTHFQTYGADQMARLVAEDTAALDIPLAEHVTEPDTPIEPPEQPAEPAEPIFEFDMQPADGVTQDGWTAVGPGTAYGDGQEYGFTAGTPGSRDRGTGFDPVPDAMERDFLLPSADTPFAVDVPNGTYAVTAYWGDMLGTASLDLTVEGVGYGSANAGRGSVSSKVLNPVEVTDGTLDVVAAGWLNGLVVAPVAEEEPRDPDQPYPDAGARQAERIDRSPVAATLPDDGVYVGWRMLGNDPEAIGFHVYRDGERITDAPVTDSTNLTDADGTAGSVYRISSVTGDDANESWATEEFTPWDGQTTDIPLDKPADGETPDGSSFTYSANDASVGDVDGDGQYEMIVKWYPSNAQDNSRSGYTGNTLLDAYEFDGTKLWRIDLGRNIRSGAHYTQFQVFDYDGDGRAEIMARTADGTTDGAGTVIGDPDADHRNGDGYVLDGPEFLTVFDGATGEALDTVDYVPPRGTVADWGDGYGNRADRFLAGTAYLDGEHPSAVFARGYYTRSVVAAFDWDGENLTERWTFDSDEAGAQWAGQGNHDMHVADVDGDRRDEIVYGSMTLNDDGTGLYSTRLGHGDAMHVSDLDPARDGLELFAAHESMSSSGNRGATFRDAATGEVLWSVPADRDLGRAAAGDIDPRYEGAEAWAIGGDYAWNSRVGELRSARGELIGTDIPAANFVTWWDGDLLREIGDHDYAEDAGAGVPTIAKWDHENGAEREIYRAAGTLSNNSTKGNPALQADLFGDWREEIVTRTEDSTALRVATTVDPTEHRLRTLMSDPVYRLSVAFQNTAYNQPPHVSYYLGEGMGTPEAPDLEYTTRPAPRQQVG